ncbi:MAG TPA: DNA-directed RNA polymerase subunit alpha [Candidatus Dojkabacteria bacterium]|nr:DNA-directed RNA polymerase subunit alpha [Candidatus Dojkabacteria bacterium]HQF36613.1 DNA-directed RNA polymerase subunit alpha [Candidatus Dojkabacteria bacterium]
MLSFDDLKVVVEEKEVGKANIEINYLPRGFGFTVGTILRRVLLGSISGFSATGIRVSGVEHEFSTIEGVKESVYEVMLNLKNIDFRIEGDDLAEVKLKVKNKGKLTSDNLELSPNVKVINKGVYILESSGLKKEVVFTITIERGVGYRPITDNDRGEIGYVPIDADFSPVKRVEFNVEDTRLGDKTNLDKLTLFIYTDKSRSADKIFGEALELVKNCFAQMSDLVKVTDSKVVPLSTESTKGEWDIDSLGLSNKVKNVLVKNGIDSIEKLTKLSADDVLSLGGLGAKSVDEIKKELKKVGLSFK